jgi:hypothetical protein
MGDSHGRFVVKTKNGHVIRRTDLCDCETVVASVLRAISGRRLVETENPSACATVCCKVCKRAITLYCLYVRVIKCECVTNC